jgi:hypothetical protein
MPKPSPGKRDSFSDVIGFPTPEHKQIPAALPSTKKHLPNTTGAPMPKMQDKNEIKQKV